MGSSLPSLSPQTEETKVRFVSKSSGYSICYKRDRIQHFASGESQVLQELWNCQFSPVGIRASEIKQAREQLHNYGMPKEQDQVTAVDPAYRYGCFDTHEFQEQHAEEGFDDAERLKMEEFLIKHQDEYYRLVEEIRVPAPWPNYNEFRGVKGTPTAVRIAERVREDGYDVLAVIAYERENANRPDVLAELEALLAPSVDDELLVSA